MTDSTNPFDGEQLQDSTFSRADMARTRIDGVLVTELLEAHGKS